MCQSNEDNVTLAQTITKEKEQNRTILLALFLSILTIIIFRDAALAMFDAWQKEEYSHGYLVPLIAGLLLFNKMNDEKITPRSSWIGFGLVLTCVIVQFLFQIANVGGLQPLVFLFALIGLFILHYGLHASRSVAGPLMLILFAAPLPKFFYYTLSFNMQMMSTSLGTTLLRILGVAVFQDGNIIDLGSCRLQVVEACNGLRYLFPLMCLGFLLAYMYKASFIKRILLFSSTLPIAIVMNSLRIALIGVTVDRWGKNMAEGLIHDFEGWIVFMGCAVLLLVEIWIMNKIGSKGFIDFESIRLPSIKSLPIPRPGRPQQTAVVFICISLGLSIVVPLLFPHYLQPVPLSTSFAEFPMQIGDWTGRKGTFNEEVLPILGTNDYLLADFSKAGEPPVNLYMLYYPQQDSTSNQAVHNPSACIPAGGWIVDSQTVKTIPLTGGEDDIEFSLTVNRLLTSKGNTKQIVYYWFVQNGMNIHDGNVSRLAVIKNAIFHGHTHGAMIRVITEYSNITDEPLADKRLATFLNQNFDRIVAFMFSSKAY